MDYAAITLHNKLKRCNFLLTSDAGCNLYNRRNYNEVELPSSLVEHTTK